VDSKDTALVVIDVQRGILDLPNLPRKKEIECALDETVERIAEIIEKARRSSAPVFFIQHDGGRGHRLEPNTPGWELRSEIAPSAGEPVIRKHACDAFFETPRDAQLRAVNARQIVIAGCMTQFCVDTSVRRGVSLGYDDALAADGHTTVDAGTLRFEQIIAHHNALLDGFDAGDHEVRVIPSGQITF